MSALPLRACPCCGLVHHLPAVPRRHRARCTRCSSTIRGASHPRSPARAAALALAALILYPLAILLPVIELQRLGHSQSASIWSGVVTLLSDGHVLIGIIVLACSILAPVGKLAALFVLCAGDALAINRKHRARTYHLVEFLGRWGMVDVLLVALLVAAVKLGDWVEVTPGPGVIAFSAVVTLSLLASAAFDPQAIWEDQ